MITYQIKDILTECKAEELRRENFRFSFALDEKGIVFIDESGYVK